MSDYLPVSNGTGLVAPEAFGWPVISEESPSGYRFHKQVWLSAKAESAAQLTTAERTKAWLLRFEFYGQKPRRDMSPDMAGVWLDRFDQINRRSGNASLLNATLGKIDAVMTCTTDWDFRLNEAGRIPRTSAADQQFGVMNFSA